MKFKKKNIEAILFICLIFSLFLAVSAYNLYSIVRGISLGQDTVQDSSWQKRIEYRVYNSIPGKTVFNEIFGTAQKLMGKKVVMDMAYGSIYKSKYGQLVFPVNSNDAYIDDILNRMEILNNELKAEGIPLLYVQAPYKVPENEVQLPKNSIDFSNSNMNKLLAGMKIRGIDTLDLRDHVFDGHMTQNEIFYNTDHHWRIEAAFDATWYIARYLNNKYNFQINIEKYSNIDNYEQRTYEKSFLGSQGRRVGKIYGGLDDFTYIIPKFETKFILTDNNGNESIVSEGSFEEAIMDKTYMPLDKKDLTVNRYAAYHGDNRELIFENRLVEKHKILLVKDSFGIPVYSFLSLGVHETRAIDLRLFKSSVSEYVKKHRPEIVIVLYNIDHIGNDMYKFEGDV